MVYANLLQAYQNLSRTATGYLVRKGWRDSNVAPADNSPLAYMIFRASEAYLNYMEADYMKNKNLDDYSKKYWRALRKRAGGMVSRQAAKRLYPSFFSRLWRLFPYRKEAFNR